jgi:serine/threonine protein kinase
MALGPSRISLVGETPYAHEREAIDFAIGALPNNDPFYLWALAEVLDPASGRLDEIDLIIIGYSAIYLVEIKSGPGRYEGDQLDWRRLVPGEPPRRMDAPYPLANSKAKRLRSLLDRKLHGQAPFVQALVFLSATDLELQLSPEGRVGVVTRETLARAITHHEFPGRNPSAPGRGSRIDAPLMKEIARAMTAIGVRPRAGKAFVGEYELGAVLQDGPGYQDREAAHRSSPRLRRRARIYLVPRATSIERRQQLWRAADREVAMLHDLREHRSILKLTDYVREAPLGPTVLFDDFEDGQRLDAFLRSHPDLSFTHQIGILMEVASALGHCHRRGIFHGAVSPEAVLVRQTASEAPPEVRLCNFQLGSSQTVEATQHRSALSSEPAALYQAPELRLDPLAAGFHSDIFSLGALAYFVLTRQPPASSVAEVEERLRRDRGLDPRAASVGIPEKVAEAVLLATHPSFAERWNEAASWGELLLECATRPEKSDEAEPDPLTVGKKTLLPPDLEVVEVLGHGASARVLKVRRQSDDRELALKVSLDPEHDERLQAEALALARLRHPRIVQLLDERSIGGRPASCSPWRASARCSRSSCAKVRWASTSPAVMATTSCRRSNISKRRACPTATSSLPTWASGVAARRPITSRCSISP